MSEQTKELFKEIQNLSDLLRQKLVAIEHEKNELGVKNENIQSQLSNAESLILQLKEEISELKSAVEKADTNLVEKSNGGRDTETIDELVKEIDYYIEKLRK
jgi:flagellar biosynthesis chaperone FliJ